MCSSDLLESWSNATATSCPASAICFIAGRDGDLVYAIYNGTYQFLAYTGNAQYSGWIDSGIAARANAWTHLALVRNGTALTFYVNGVSVKTATLSANTVGGYSTTGWPFSVGYFGYGSHYFAGQIDEVRYWSTARTAAQIATDMQTWGASNATGLVGYWDFNDGSGATAANQVSNAVAGTALTLTGSPTWPTIATTTTSGGRTVVSFPRSYLTVSGGWTAPSGVTNVDYLTVAGGGGGGAWVGGGGGGGGVAQGTKVVGATANAVTVGMGGLGTKWNNYAATLVGTNGLASGFADVSVAGGGRGGSCLVRSSSKGFLFRFKGGAPGWQQLGLPASTRSEILISADGRQVLQVLLNEPLR